MAKTPAVLWYFNDWNGGTITLSRFIKGCYMDLLTAQFNSGHLSLEEIKTVLGNDFAVWGTLSKKFAVDETGKYFNVRLDNEMYNSRKYKPKKIASASLAGLISSEKRLNYEQRESIKKAFQINDFIELEEELMKQTIKKWFNQMVNQMVNDLEDEKENKKEEIRISVKPLGMEIVRETATEAWSDKAWVEQLAMGVRLSIGDIKLWMSQFNASICNDSIQDFNERVYKKMFVGWLSMKQSKGRKLIAPEVNDQKIGLKKLEI
ncbi:MAG TPA: hypothetical protein PKD00_04965 [Burkholderiales bacterium]|nr:hypothetical protein [Burkholderiales bacterium]